MGVYSQNQKYEDIFQGAVTGNDISIPIFCPDFKTVQFSILTNALANFDIEVVLSNQDLTPPNPALAVSATNQYTTGVYVDQSDQASYDSVTPNNYNPTATAVNKIFEVQTNGARWFFVRVKNYVAGSLLTSDADLFSNFT